MKDDKGLYYYPFPRNHRVRMYVRKSEDGVSFRLWSQDDPKLWEEHGWVPYDAIKQAATMYKSGNFNPDQAYDIRAAKALIEEDKRSQTQG